MFLACVLFPLCCSSSVPSLLCIAPTKYAKLFPIYATILCYSSSDFSPLRCPSPLYVIPHLCHYSSMLFLTYAIIPLCYSSSMPLFLYVFPACPDLFGPRWVLPPSIFTAIQTSQLTNHDQRIMTFSIKPWQAEILRTRT